MDSSVIQISITPSLPGRPIPPAQTPKSPPNGTLVQPFPKNKNKKNKKRPIPLNLAELSNARVIQSNLIYVTNIPAKFADDDLLKRYEYFGQYGNIKKFSINKSITHGETDAPPTYGAYVTYSTDEEAALCLKAVNNFELEGNTLVATYGTTKYCAYFLKGNPCPKKECLYLHKLGNQGDTLARDIMPNVKHIQPKDAAIDRMRVIILPPDHNTKFPIARVVRERATSAGSTSPRRLRHSDRPRNRNFHLVESEDQEPEIPEIVNKLRKMASPCQDVVEVPSDAIEEIMSPASPDRWAADILDISPKLPLTPHPLRLVIEEDTFLVASKPYKNKII
ncbi:unnamed protein product [Blepharisma stoltei]|uniref:RRM domain-containing protein n=1 Tax=Blepharisma stoltei TaxID=1481888 RepID=A0AAU9JRD2_9CILI|nr:unnamed protein product [Blepharisma stoltei]